MKHFEVGIYNLKESVQHFENFNAKYEALDSQKEAAGAEDEVTLGMIKQKLFVDEFFDPKTSI